MFCIINTCLYIPFTGTGVPLSYPAGSWPENSFNYKARYSFHMNFPVRHKEPNNEPESKRNMCFANGFWKIALPSTGYHITTQATKLLNYLHNRLQICLCNPHIEMSEKGYLSINRS